MRTLSAAVVLVLLAVGPAPAAPPPPETPRAEPAGKLSFEAAVTYGDRTQKFTTPAAALARLQVVQKLLARPVAEGGAAPAFSAVLKLNGQEKSFADGAEATAMCQRIVQALARTRTDGSDPAKLEFPDEKAAVADAEAAPPAANLPAAVPMPEGFAPGIPVRGGNQGPPVAMPDKLDEIYAAMTLTDGTIGAGPFKPGDTVAISFTLKNLYTHDIYPPAVPNSNNRPCVGVIQYWLQYAGSPQKIASGGFMVLTRPTIKAGETLPLVQINTNKIDTARFLKGKYRFFAEYKTADTAKVLQLKTVDFELR